VSIAPNEVDEIRQRMAMIRHDLHEDVRGVVVTAEKVAGWTNVIARYPWLSLGLAVGIGYVVVPKRKASPATLVSSADLRALQEAVHETKAVASGHASSAPAETSLIAMGVGLLAPLVVRAAQNYALKYLENWIAQQHFSHPSPMGEPDSPRIRTGERRDRP
jgi:hypothetical protein